MQLFCRTALLALSAAALLGLPQTTLAQPEAGTIQPSLAGKAEHRHGRLDSILNAVVATYERALDSASERQSAAGESAAAQAAAQDAASRMAARRAPMRQGPSVAVTLRIEDASKIEAIARFLEDNGGDPRNLGEDYIEAYVPVRLLVAASKQPGVLRVQAIIPPQPKRGPVVSQGVAVHGASLWHALGVTGKGVKVGVIDTGFSGLRRLIGSELPAPVAARCYKSMGEPTSQLSNCENEGDVHGTAVAEALLDIAPDVSLYVADSLSNGDLASAVDWMAEQGVQVINLSATMPWDGPGDGTSPHSDSPLKTVDAAVREGIVWVNAAGNEGKSAWFGQFRDVNGNNYHDFAYWRHSGNPVECIPLDVTSEDNGLSVQLRWQGRWGTKDPLADLDLFLHEGTPIAVGPVVQAGRDFQNYVNSDYPGTKEPNEYLSYKARPGKSYCLSITWDTEYSYGVPSPDWIQLIELQGIRFTDGRNDFSTPEGSIGNPAESANPGLLAVGAAPWNNTQSIEEYSSRGPTPDGRIKPDIVGVDMAYSLSCRLPEYCGIPNNPSGLFPGTSQASPHVAGLAALVRAAYPNLGPHEVANYLKANADSRTYDPSYGRLPDLNVIWGYGLARLLPISIPYRERIQSGEGSRQIPLSDFFPTADAYTRFTAASSNPELVRVEIRQGRLIFIPVQDGEGQATITVTARFRGGLQATVRIALTVERALLWPRSFSGWRLGRLNPPVSTTTSTTTPFQDAFIE